jgi:hypothetical protein
LEKKFVVRFKKTHGKLMGLSCVPTKMHGKLFFTVGFFLCRAPHIERTVNIFTHGKSEFSRSASCLP